MRRAMLCACLVVDHTVITVAADSPIRTLRDLIERLKADLGLAK